jgi:phospholipase C
VEDNWLQGQRIGTGSFDAIAGSMDGMFDFKQAPRHDVLILSPSTGEVQAGKQGNRR